MKRIENKTTATATARPAWMDTPRMADQIFTLPIMLNSAVLVVFLGWLLSTAKKWIDLRGHYACFNTSSEHLLQIELYFDVAKEAFLCWDWFDTQAQRDAQIVCGAMAILVVGLIGLWITGPMHHFYISRPFAVQKRRLDMADKVAKATTAKELERVYDDFMRMPAVDRYDFYDVLDASPHLDTRQLALMAVRLPRYLRHV